MPVKLAIVLLILMVVVVVVVAMVLLARRAYREFRRRRADPIQRALMDTVQEQAHFDRELKQRARVRRDR